MRQEVYVKFASAVESGRASRIAARRMDIARVKVAAMSAVTHVARARTVKSAAAPENLVSDTTVGDTIRKWVTPSKLLGAGLGVGGAYAAGKAFGIDPWKLALGAGALYGGYQLFTNPHVRELVDIYGGEALNYLRSKFGFGQQDAQAPTPAAPAPTPAAPVPRQNAGVGSQISEATAEIMRRGRAAVSPWVSNFPYLLEGYEAWHNGQAAQ